MKALLQRVAVIGAGVRGLDHIRFSHNYVRGRWAKEANNTFLLLHKCSHDIDFLAWLADEPCLRVSSFGSLGYFTPVNAPAGSSKRCVDCSLKNSCIYSAIRLYVDDDLTGRIQDLGDTQTCKAKLEAISNGPFGVCVWQAGNDVVDHQVVSMEFQSGATATCTMSGYSASHGRRTRLQGTHGELLFDEAADSIMIKRFDSNDTQAVQIEKSDGYHPEDKDIVAKWLDTICDASADGIMVTAAEAMRTHAIVFAAEQSRKDNRTVELSKFYDTGKSGGRKDL